MLVKDIMVQKTTMIEASETVQTAAQVMKDKDIGAILVTQDSKIIGIMTTTDLVRRIIVEQRNANEVLVRDIMSSPLVMIDENATLLDVSELFRRYKIKRVAVSSKDGIVGMITASIIGQNLREILN